VAAQAPSPSLTFGIKEAALSRPDADQIVARLVCEVTDAIVEVFGERVRAGVTGELVGIPAGRTVPADLVLLVGQVGENLRGRILVKTSSGLIVCGNPALRSDTGRRSGRG
jgi:hypothetical protein